MASAGDGFGGRVIMDGAVFKRKNVARALPFIKIIERKLHHRSTRG
jgi:hypothetical protein